VLRSAHGFSGFEEMEEIVKPIFCCQRRRGWGFAFRRHKVWVGAGGEQQSSDFEATFVGFFEADISANQIDFIHLSDGG
jgi:hypothetical protein